MLDYARGERGWLQNVRYEQADAVDLPYTDGAFDAVLCQFGLMFVQDRAAALCEARRVLKPGGMLAADIATGLIEGNPTITETLARATASPETIIAALAESVRETLGDEPVRTPLQAIVFTAASSSG